MIRKGESKVNEPERKQLTAGSLTPQHSWGRGKQQQKFCSKLRVGFHIA